MSGRSAIRLFSLDPAASVGARRREELGWEPRVSLAEGMAPDEEWPGKEGLL
jgi:hypothetical protein